MSDFILKYEELETISKYSIELGKRSEEYGNHLERQIVTAIGSVTGSSSGYLMNASDSVRDKINDLKQNSEKFYHFGEEILNLLEVAMQMDQEVADAITAQREYFLEHHESLRMVDWRARLLDLFVDIKNSIPLLGLIADILDSLNTIFEALGDSIKHWYECEGGKYIVEAIGSVLVGVAAIVLFVIAIPASGFFAICGAIGAGIGLINSVTNVATSFRAADAATDGNPSWAVIYGKQNKLSDVLRQKNFGNGFLNDLSYFGAGAIDTAELLCDMVGFAEMGAGIAKLFKGNTFKLLKNKGSLNFSDLKNSAKNGIVDLKSNIKQGYTNLKNNIKANTNPKSLLGDMSAEDLERYNKYWDDVADGDYDVPFGMNADEYYQHLKGLDKVDDAVKGGSKIVGKSSGVINILDNMPELSGSTRDKLLSTIQNRDLSKIVNELYRPGATVGDGGTAAKLVQEFYEGSSTHLIKAQQRLNQLNNLAKSGKLGLNDLDILDALRDDLNNAVNLFK